VKKIIKMQRCLSALACMLMLYAPNALAENALGSFSHTYANINLKIKLATTQNAQPCEGEQCDINLAFDQKVQQIGQKLSISAFALYPALETRIPYFAFNIADKKEAGTASNADGQIVVFRGVQTLMLSDEALTFILAREMSHVIAKHHHKNTSTKLIISALATVFFPVSGIIAASTSFAQASVITTAVSNIGTEVVMLNVKPAQLKESDNMALLLLENQQCEKQAVVNGLPLIGHAQNAWLRDLDKSKAQLQLVLNPLELPIAQMALAP
jgi:hypothetical protein